MHDFVKMTLENTTQEWTLSLMKPAVYHYKAEQDCQDTCSIHSTLSGISSTALFLAYPLTASVIVHSEAANDN